MVLLAPFFFSSRRRHTRLVSDWSSDVCSSDLARLVRGADHRRRPAGAPGRAVARCFHRRAPRGAARSLPGGGNGGGAARAPQRAATAEASRGERGGRAPARDDGPAFALTPGKGESSGVTG